MPKGLYTQTVCLLLQDSTSLDQIEQSFESNEPANRIEASEHWAFGGQSIIYSFGKQDEGRLIIDQFDHVWPDAMGDPKKEPYIFTAWSMGNFGPGTFPGGLVRAAQHSVFWPEAVQVVPTHQAVLRMRTTYAVGADENQPLLPENYDPVAELEMLFQGLSFLTSLPMALCFFNPTGEVVRAASQIESILAFSQKNKLPPLDLISNIRMFALDDNWTMMDIVGNVQLDLPDVEAIFRSQAYNPNAVAGFLRNLTLYLLSAEKEINDGDTLDGPTGCLWTFKKREQSLSDPPREVWQVTPDDGHTMPEIQYE